MKHVTSLRPAVFLDRDGTLNEVLYTRDGVPDSPFCANDLVLSPGAGIFTKNVRNAGYLGVLVTNQPGIAKGSITIEGLDILHKSLINLLEVEGGGLDGVYFCPHHPVGRAGYLSPMITRCSCRKPSPGLLLEAAAQMGIDLSCSWMVGDRPTDIQAGKAAGCKTILITDSRAPTQAGRYGNRNPTYVAKDLSHACDLILRASSGQSLRAADFRMNALNRK